MQGVGERLRARAAELDMSDADVARRAGLNPRRYGNYVTNDREPDYATLKRICDALDCSADYILGLSPEPGVGDRGMTMVRELDLRAAAGLNSSAIEVFDGREGEATLAMHGFPVEGFRETYGAPPAEVVIVPVVGDSMEPTLFSGQKVMAHTRDRVPSPPGIFVLWDGLGLVIKRVQYIPHSDPPRVRIASDNARYEPYERTLDEAHIMARVIGKWGRV
jgi:transcriptional regulator with XRE-family HTH domain